MTLLNVDHIPREEDKTKKGQFPAPYPILPPAASNAIGKIACSPEGNLVIHPQRGGTVAVEDPYIRHKDGAVIPLHAGDIVMFTILPPKDGLSWRATSITLVHAPCGYEK